MNFNSSLFLFGFLPITVSVYDPTGEPILKAFYEPQEGVRYEVAQTKDSPRRTVASARPGVGATTAPRSAPRGGLSDKDRKFADWAMTKGGDYLRWLSAGLFNAGIDCVAAKGSELDQASGMYATEMPPISTR